MDIPEPGDYIDIHTHGARPMEGVFSVENLMAHQNLQPQRVKGMAFTAGIHPWHLTESNQKQLMDYIKNIARNSDLTAIGEAGFDKIRGPSIELQRKVFEEQVIMAAEIQKPVIIHCVRAWDELLAAHKKSRPAIPWLVHGFRGKKELALQLINRGMYLSFWFDFILRPESAELLKNLPEDRIFLETDGADVSIRDIYKKVGADLNISEEGLKAIIFSNYCTLFKGNNVGN